MVRFLPLLMRSLAGAFAAVAAEVRDTAENALLAFLRTPARFDPAKGRLGAYLRNLLARERRLDIPLGSIAEPVECQNCPRDDPGLPASCGRTRRPGGH